MHHFLCAIGDSKKSNAIENEIDHKNINKSSENQTLEQLLKIIRIKIKEFEF